MNPGGTVLAADLVSEPRVAALFVDPRGPYPSLEDVDCWTERRDARGYAGPHPVVAHPPCHLWTNLSRVNYKRYGGDHNKPGNDGGCFSAALCAVRQWGGVLEHPAFSHAWKRFDLARPVGAWSCVRQGEWVCEVAQSAYGHAARKRTWLLYVGRTDPPDLIWDQPEGTHQCGWFDRKKPTLGKRQASLTPKPFAELLVRLARLSLG